MQGTSERASAMLSAIFPRPPEGPATASHTPPARMALTRTYPLQPVMAASGGCGYAQTPPTRLLFAPSSDGSTPCLQGISAQKGDAAHGRRLFHEFSQAETPSPMSLEKARSRYRVLVSAAQVIESISWQEQLQLEHWAKARVFKRRPLKALHSRLQESGSICSREEQPNKDSVAGDHKIMRTINASRPADERSKTEVELLHAWHRRLRAATKASVLLQLLNWELQEDTWLRCSRITSSFSKSTARKTRACYWCRCCQHNSPSGGKGNGGKDGGMCNQMHGGMIGQGQNARMIMGGKQGKGGPIPQMMGMGAMGKGMPMNMPGATGKGGMPVLDKSQIIEDEHRLLHLEARLSHLGDQQDQMLRILERIARCLVSFCVSTCQPDPPCLRALRDDGWDV
eukprot:symbB.v1.2.023890.t1/scaffold2222.1/size85392/6